MKLLLPILLIAALIWILRRQGDDGDDRGPRDPEPYKPDGHDVFKPRRERENVD